ncbi:MAG: response regulator [Elusimicrobia bacterium]|jgi:two-component system cell cycle sensor histidine kinase/response regulator CckA|nr:response regulator [Elusimicrobiota bacterium]
MTDSKTNGLSPDPFKSDLPLRSLTADVAHEISNQLGCLVLLPDLILGHLPPESPLANDLRQIRRAAHRIDELSTHLSLLSLDRDERATLNLNLPVHQATETEGWTALLRDHPETTVQTTLEEILPPISGSADWILVIAGNLLRNALDAHPQGAIAVSTFPKTLNEDFDGWERIPLGSYAVLSVTDRGPVLTPVHRLKLFEPYYASNTLGRRSMSGLGMAVVRQLARRQGAYLDVRSEGQGTTIDLYFPASVMAGKPQSTPPLRDKVLVVDDREEQRNVISRILKGQGYAVASLAGGTEAITHLEEHGGDLIILDISLRRDREGLDLHAQIRSRWPAKKILLISGHPREAYADVLGRVGDCPFLKKPFRAEELLVAAGNLLPPPNPVRISLPT